MNEFKIYPVILEISNNRHAGNEARVIRYLLEARCMRFPLSLRLSWNNQAGKKVKKRILSRSELLPFFSTLEPTVVVIESCGSANHWGRKFTEFGHEVKLIAPQYVMPYRRKNKNDFNDAEAIAEATQRSNMTFMPIKSIEQQDAQMLLRIRDRHVQNRVQLSNQIRGLLAEYGLVIPSLGKAALRKALPEFLRRCREYFNRFQPLFILRVIRRIASVR
ncbi:Mobile element protein [Vibrio casei]|nr:Mobile element protein [Vibrio casei]